jgi:putative copper resistance protein D
MIEPAIVVVRLLQYAGAAVLVGAPLLFVWLVPAPPRAARWVGAAAAVLAVASLLAVTLQAILFAGSVAEGLAGESLAAVALNMGLGQAAMVRAAAAGLALVALVALRGQVRWIAAAGCGLVAAASLAWLGHAGAGESIAHLAADIVHVVAASAWLGALAGFLLLLHRDRSADYDRALAEGLAGFAGLGSVLVAAIVATGLVNAWFLIGPSGWPQLAGDPYGRVLLAKLALFAAMLALAAANRWHLAPALRREPGSTGLAALRRSITAESLAGIGVLALVAWLGTLEPPGAA